MCALLTRIRFVVAGVGLWLAPHLLFAQDLPRLPQPSFPQPGEGAPEAAAPNVDVPKPDALKPDALKPDADAQAKAALRELIAKKLGQAQDGHFILVFSNACPATRPADGRLPPGARLLSGNRWLEVIYQVEMTEGQQAAIDLIMKFIDHTQTHPNAKYDWGLVVRHDDEAKAQQLLQLAQAKYGKASITFRPRNAGGLRFFNEPEGQFFKPRIVNP